MSGAEGEEEEGPYRVPDYTDRAKVDMIFDDMYQEVRP